MALRCCRPLLFHELLADGRAVGHGFLTTLASAKVVSRAAAEAGAFPPPREALRRTRRSLGEGGRPASLVVDQHVPVPLAQP